MNGKLTWKDVYDDFKIHFPNLSQSVVGFMPYAYATIQLICEGGGHMIYNYDTKKVEMLQKD